MVEIFACLNVAQWFFFSCVLNFAIFLKSRKLVLAKIGKYKVDINRVEKMYADFVNLALVTEIERGCLNY